MASGGKICRYLDVPIQHCSTNILRRMKRGGSRPSLVRTIERIRKKIPDITLRTTMIVGFPGEREEDFLELQDFCREVEFDRLGVFAYSMEENTSAGRLSGRVPARTARKRRRLLLKQQHGIARRKNRELLGKELPILIEGPSPQSDLLLQGRLESQAPEIDGVCLINDSEVGNLLSGEFRTVRITRILGHDLLGTIIR
jgi:ribosomal protein S12 methylthiotransferase